VHGAEGQIRTDDTRLFRAVLYQLSYLGAGVAEGSSAALAGFTVGGRKDTDGSPAPQPAPAQRGPSMPMRPAMFSSARIRSPIGGWVSHSDFDRSSKLLIGLTM
jgi:hypothetical protein